MDILQTVFQGLVDLGASVFLPIVITLIGIILGMKPTKAFSAGLTLGVALVGMNHVMSLMTDSVGAAAQAFVQNTGVQLKALDMGWAPALGLCWTWEYAFLMFPVQIGINILLLAVGFTNCLNVDMWNVGNKVCTAFLVAYVSGNPAIGFACAIIQCVFELKNADCTKYRLQKLTGIPGISMPHPMFLAGIYYYPLTHFLDKIIPDSMNIDAQKIRDKIGIFGENHIMGFIVGCFIGIFGGYDYKEVLTLGVQAGTALTLFPMVAKLFHDRSDTGEQWGDRIYEEEVPWKRYFHRNGLAGYGRPFRTLADDDPCDPGNLHLCNLSAGKYRAPIRRTDGYLSDRSAVLSYYGKYAENGDRYVDRPSASSICGFLFCAAFYKACTDHRRGIRAEGTDACMVRHRYIRTSLGFCGGI